MSSDSVYAEELKSLLGTSIYASGYFTSSKYLMQQFIYNEVKEHATLQMDSVLNDFYLTNQTSAIGLINSINDEIRNQNYAIASSENTSISASNIIEHNQQNFNSIYLSNLDVRSNYSSVDSTILYKIAIQCSIDGGNAVNQSRNLLMFIENHVINFSDKCSVNGDDRSMGISQSKSDNNIMLYPNPNSGSMTLEYKLKEGESGLVNIYSLNGKLMDSYKLNNNTSKISINESSLDVGVYMYEVMINNKKVKTDKIVIIK
jgi:hypothetical protein